MPYLKISGIKMAVETFGDMDNLAIILLQGGVTGQIGRHTWEAHDFAKRLAEHFFVVTYDRRGHGYTPFSGSFDDTALDVVAVMDALCLEKAMVLGVSAGTYIGGRTAILKPERVAGLILVVPHSHAEGKTPFNAWAERNHVDLTNYDFKKIMDDTCWAPMTPKEIKEESNALQAKYSYIPALSPEETIAAYKAMGWFDNRPGFAELKVPTLIISGEYDVLCPAEVGREIHKLIKGSEYVEFENCAHGLIDERPDEFITRVTEFCTKISVK